MCGTTIIQYELPGPMAAELCSQVRPGASGSDSLTSAKPDSEAAF